MNRRTFLRSIQSAAALSVMPSGAAVALGQQEKEKETPAKPPVYVAPHAINGSVARILMPPNEPLLPQSALFRGLRFIGRYRNYLPKGIKWGWRYLVPKLVRRRKSIQQLHGWDDLRQRRQRHSDLVRMVARLQRRILQRSRRWSRRCVRNHRQCCSPGR